MTLKTPKRILERRASVRVVDSLSFKIGHEDYEVEATTINISSHGAMCIVSNNIPMMTQLKIGFTLALPGGVKRRAKQIKAKGVVVRKETGEDLGRVLIGIYFTQIREADQKALDRYIKGRLLKDES